MTYSAITSPTPAYSGLTPGRVFVSPVHGQKAEERKSEEGDQSKIVQRPLQARSNLRLASPQSRTISPAVRWHNSSRVNPAPGFIEPCLPTVAPAPPSGELWLHEIKHDGYRLMVKRHGDAIRIYTRRGADWTHRFPAIVATARKLKAFSFHIDGEGVVCRDDGLAVFDRLHSKGHDAECFLFAFDLIEHDGEDLRRLALVERKPRLRALLARRKSGIVYNEHLDGDGATIFAHACKLGFEGIVSKRRDFAYSSGRSKGWLKVKNPKAPAALRIEEGTF